MQMQGIQNKWNNSEKEQSWWTHTSQFQTLLQSYSIQVGVDWYKDSFIDRPV